jgi:anti-anti-sigma factor
MNTDLDLKIHKVNEIPVLDLSGDVDEFTCTKLRVALRDLLSNGESRVVVNLARVNYMDSAGLGTLVGGLRRIMEADGGLVLSGPNPQIERVLSLTGLDRILKIYDGEDVAVDSLMSRQ